MKNITLLTLILTSTCYSSIALSQTSQLRADEPVKKKIDESAWHYYEVDIDKPSKLTVKLRRISRDVDMFVARDDKPTKDNFLCAPQKEGKQIETCRLTSHTPGKWFVGIYGKMDSKYQLGIETKDMKYISKINNAKLH